ncbi:glycosyltransferase [Streptomyces cyaneofuscatus]|uniref:glycosyltransferase n=1 Tax=Streptomyces cyaneofuscatus TaxID=66883 RepID=UPI002D76A4FE|nr:glycosyltransferase [Streptomyces cyaneofuscatus]WRO08418.1 glycosyltransferase [Streptomyces cyaneofuscatus]
MAESLAHHRPSRSPRRTTSTYRDVEAMNSHAPGQAYGSDGTIRVASVPANHVYVRHLSPPEGDRVTRLDDPRPNGAPSGSQQWWPPVMLDPGWVDEHADAFDVFHLHFGFDAQTPAALQELLAALRRNGKPLVYTVHDLVNPHHVDEGEHQAQLDVLIPGADRLITLTPGAAQEIAARWGRTATVLPHPHVVEPEGLVRPRPGTTRSRSASTPRASAPTWTPFRWSAYSPTSCRNSPARCSASTATRTSTTRRATGTRPACSTNCAG